MKNHPHAIRDGIMAVWFLFMLFFYWFGFPWAHRMDDRLRAKRAQKRFEKIRRAIHEGGGDFVGTMVVPACKAYRDHPAREGYLLVMFNSPATHSTLALPEFEVTAESVRRHIKESNEKFGVTGS